MGSIPGQEPVESSANPKCYRGLNAAAVTRMYHAMYLSRKLDDRQLQLKQQQKVFFQASGAGHEAVAVAAGMALRAESDWFYPYYRDQALCLMLGMKPVDLLLEAVGAKDSPCSGARQMPGHWGNKDLHIVSQSSTTGMQFLQAVGCAEASLYFGQFPEAAGRADTVFDNQEVVYVSGGEGATSEGEFWEALSTASNSRLPVLFLIEDNGYAISVPVEVQTPGGSISKLVTSFPSLLTRTCDGTDLLESYATISEAVAYCRARKGPALVHANVIRLHSHSISDDQRLYRTNEEREAEVRRDPVPNFRRFLLREEILSEEELKSLENDVEKEILESTDTALAAEIPDPENVTLYIYSPVVDPTSVKFSTPPQTEGEPKTMVDLINACLHDEMERDPRILVFGEDIADVSREQYLGLLRGKGGVFKATAALQRRYGSQRVFNSSLAEAGIVGRAIGMATRGLKPVIEIQFFDYIWPAMMQIRDEMAVLRWRSFDNFKCPVVIRVPIGGYLNGGAIYHSQSGEVIFTHVPGLRVVMPSTGDDANGLLRTAIRSDDPVLFLEPKHLYRQTYNRAPYPGSDYMIPFGKAKIVREGNDLTIVTYGSTVIRSLQAANTLEKQDGISVEILDLRSLSPYDWLAIEESVRKTSRVIVVHEDWLSWGYGAEIVARIGDELFEFLDAPARRVAAMDTFCAYHPVLEDHILPQTDHILRTVRALLAF